MPTLNLFQGGWGLGGVVWAPVLLDTGLVVLWPGSSNETTGDIGIFEACWEYSLTWTPE